MHTERKEIIRYEGISKNFGHKSVLENVSFSILDGEIFGVIGMSGSGKTTLLNLLVGFIEPEVGDVKFLSDLCPDLECRDVYMSAFDNRDAVKKLFGFAAQSPSFYEKLTAAENIDYFGCLYDLRRSMRKTNAKILLRLMGLEESAKRLGCELSGGMQKRLDIACALVHDPKVLILDEPTANLDPLLRKQMWELIRKINQGGTTIIISSHFLEEIESLCDRVAIVHEGKVLEIGAPSEMRSLDQGNEEIIIETSPGDYPRLIPKIRGIGPSIRSVTVVGNKLCVTASKTEAVLHKLLHILEASQEILVGVQIEKSSMTDLFEKIAAGHHDSLGGPLDRLSHRRVLQSGGRF